MIVFHSLTPQPLIFHSLPIVSSVCKRNHVSMSALYCIYTLLSKAYLKFRMELTTFTGFINIDICRYFEASGGKKIQHHAWRKKNGLHQFCSYLVLTHRVRVTHLISPP